MKSNPNRIITLGLIALGVILLLAACAGPSGSAGPAGPAGVTGVAGAAGPAGPAGKAAINVPGAGLKIKILDAKIPDNGKPVITLSITDADGRPMSNKVLEGYGFTIAQIMTDEATGLTKYQNLLTRDVDGRPYTVGGKTVQPAMAKAKQAFADSGGVWAAVDDIKFTYTFTNTVTTPANPALTTTIAVSAWKDARATVVNDVFSFVPSGGAVKTTREVVSTAACGTCHNPIMIHGGTRRETGLCVTCHTDQTTDPETGNTVDFKVLIHRLHSCTWLPSVAVDKKPYMIVGNALNVFDFSKGTWPQDTRNCTVCHAGGAQKDNYKTASNTAACLSCHDKVNFATGDNHAGGRQGDDKKCASCHEPDGKEFDASVTGSHVIPAQSKSVKGVKLAISGVVTSTTGSPTVTFKVTDNSGKTIAPVDMDYLAFTLAGPTTDYVNRATEVVYRKAAAGQPAAPAPKVEDAGGGAFRYTFTYKIPPDATGSYAVGMEGYVMETIAGVKDPVRIAGFNPVTYFALDGKTPAPRLQVVDRANCNKCHSSLALHGTIRQNTDYCVMCHNPMASDEAQRKADKMPPTTINFRVLVHRIHRGEELTQKPFQVYGFGGNPIDFSNVIFPGNLASCQTCHKAGTNDLPLPRVLQPTTITQGGQVVSTTLPIRSVCTSCHDSKPVAGHIELQTTSSGIETCEVCHGAGKEFDVVKVHK
ncbi:MAG: OmcA/MtrC family decaheme c-type cytochrome [Chloroflexi bacterium]|nr:OmcA/MtrC family decaheme c-type cytochrome [Chloroflexota bacterium]